MGNIGAMHFTQSSQFQTQQAHTTAEGGCTSGRDEYTRIRTAPNDGAPAMSTHAVWSSRATLVKI